MRNPNGFGGVCKLSGRRRKPFYARVTIGWGVVDEETGEILEIVESTDKIEDLPPGAKIKQLYKPIGSFKTRGEALTALVEYKKDPHSLDAATITFKEVYDAWYAWKFNPKRKKQLSKQSKSSYRASYNTVARLHNMRWLDIRPLHMQDVIDECENGLVSLQNLRLLFNQLYEFALMNDIGEKNYAQFLEIDVVDEKEEIHKPFSNKELDILWSKVNEIEGVDTALIMAYSGLRPTEMLILEINKIDLENRIMRGGIKTESGKDRIIPIHKKILPLITKRMKEGNKYLIYFVGKEISYDTYRTKIWDPMIAKLNMSHLPHDGRHTLGTMLDNAGANKTSIKRIMGHSTKKDVTNTYTHKDIEELKKAIDLI
ncbi:site-specific integrase [Dehalobacter sp.]|uniref:tyrosine-type recombinase/integrase n=1 Tax=Dehalobacter sp. TaxID=1962289 RepID=UPI00258321DD|nr:site-specific integrase [Dehalobacter sp.]MDJ0305358.1 site-specific integrase [Dehalobacter sp.]